jgi:hypothetical protein
MSIAEINNKGAIVGLFRGNTVDGTFYPMEGEASLTRV